MIKNEITFENIQFLIGMEPSSNLVIVTPHNRFFTFSAEFTERLANHICNVNNLDLSSLLWVEEEDTEGYLVEFAVYNNKLRYRKKSLIDEGQVLVFKSL